MSTQVQPAGHFFQVNIKSINKLISLWRGHRVRRNFLPKDLYKAAKDYIEELPNTDELPRASSGLTKVYIPRNLSVVFKELGVERSKSRFFTMWNARDLCIKNGYRHLLIPTAHPYKKYNIEEKLPVYNVKQIEQIALYEDNQQKFTAVVKEFVGFLCQSIFPDIVTFTHPYQRNNHIPLVRSDNLPLLIEDDVGKVALIDLGGYKIRIEKLSLTEAIENTKTALFIFPYHFNDIFEVVKIFCPEVVSQFDSLQDLYRETVSAYASIYKDHRSFVQQKIISKKLNLESIEQRKHNLLKKVQSEIDIILQNPNSSFSNPNLQRLFIEKIMAPIIDKLVESHLQEEVSTSYLCSRRIKFNEESFSDVSQDFSTCKEIYLLLINILNKFYQDKEIAYVNQYYCRFKKLSIMVHY